MYSKVASENCKDMEVDTGYFLQRSLPMIAIDVAADGQVCQIR